MWATRVVVDFRFSIVPPGTGNPGSVGGLVTRFFVRGLTPRFLLGPCVPIWLRDFVSPGFYRGSELDAPLAQVPAGSIFHSIFLPRDFL